MYLCRIWLFWLTKSAKSSWNLVGKLENSPECSCSSGRSGFTGFEVGDSKPTLQRRVLELKTCIWPPEQSDRVEEGRVRAGGRVGWTALSMSVELSSLISYFAIFTLVIKSCRVTGFMFVPSCFIFAFSFLTFSPFPHSVTWCPYFLHLIQAISISIESFNFSK